MSIDQGAPVLEKKSFGATEEKKNGGREVNRKILERAGKSGVSDIHLCSRLADKPQRHREAIAVRGGGDQGGKGAENA